MEKHVEHLYEQHNQAGVSPERLQQLFEKLPVNWPGEDAEVCAKMMQSELALLRSRVSGGCNHAVRDASKQSLDLCRVMPCFALAVVVRFAGRCGIPEELVSCW